MKGPIAMNLPSGNTAATLATGISAGGISFLSRFNIPTDEFLVGLVCAAIGAVAWQFLVAQSAREDAAAKGIAAKDRPTVDLVTVGYALFGAPLVAGALIVLIHSFGGTANFLSFGGFMVAGAGGPRLVRPIVALLLSVIPKPKGGDQ